jgi:YD repeat-containing protein
MAPDARPFAPIDSSGIDSVSLTSGGLQLHIPLWSFPQRGNLSLTFNLVYDNPSYDKIHDCEIHNIQPSTPCKDRWNFRTESVGFGPGISYGSGVQISSSTDIGIEAATAWIISSGGDDSWICYATPGHPASNSDCTLAIDPSGTLNTDGGTPSLSYNSNGYYWILSTPDRGAHKMAKVSAGTYRSIDGTGWKYVESSCTATDKDGVSYVFHCLNPTNSLSQAGLVPSVVPDRLLYVEDPNGNNIQLNYTSYVSSSDGLTYYIFTGWTDSLGRVIPRIQGTQVSTTACPVGPSYASAYSQSLPGVQDPLIICWGNLHVHTNFFAGAGYPDLSFGTTMDDPRNRKYEVSEDDGVLQAIVLPGSQIWQFGYSPNNGDGVHNYGELDQITLPTGGTISYEWAQDYNVCSHPYRTEARSRVIKRTLSDGITNQAWLYTLTGAGQQLNTGIWLPGVMTVTDPLQNATVHTLSFLAGCSAYETDTQYRDSSNAVVRSEHTDYQIIPVLNVINTSAIRDDVVTAALPHVVSSSWPDGTTKSVQYDYDDGFTATGYDGTSATIPYGNIVTTTEYDYGSGGSSGSALRTTVNDYWAFNNRSALDVNILARPSKVTITDPVTGKQQITKYGYDETSLVSGNASNGWNPTPPNGSTRGNQTSIQRFLDTSATYLTNSLAYTDTGLVASITDPAGHSTSFDHSGTYDGGYLTKVKNALGHLAQYSYDSASGLPLTSTDVNSQITTYSYDTGNRLHSVSFPQDAGGSPETDLNYLSPTLIEKKVKENATTWVVTHTTYDGLGRSIETQMLNGCPGGNPIQTTTSYDSLGRPWYVSNPYCSTSDSTYGQTQYLYDAIGRKTYQYQPDGSSYLHWTYSGNVTNFTDEAGISWQRTTDALNRLKQVTQLGNTSNPLNLETDYSYDGFDNLTAVIQHGLSTETPRMRSFTYDSLSRLFCASNPETSQNSCPSSATATMPSGVMTYNYDSDGNPSAKTDARGVVTNYAYDALNRVLSKTYTNAPAGGLVSCFQYDTATNGIGRLGVDWTQSGTCATSPPANPKSLRTILAYDDMGRVLQDQRCTGIRCNSPQVLRPMTYSYDLAGNPTRSGDGLSTRSFITQYDQAGRLLNFSAGVPGSATSLFSVQSYSPVGLTGATLGSQMSVERTYDNRTRLTGETVVIP